MPVEEARSILDAEYRRPIRRGDLQDVEPDRVVGIVDGVFEQDLAVSPTEIRQAIGRGVRIFGSSSMGALRASEVPEMVGVGRVYEMYARAEILRDDEVALLFDPGTGRSLTEPLVNVRYSLRRLVESGSLSAEAGAKILAAAEGLYYKDRSVRHILRTAGVPDEEVPSLAAALKTYDLKSEDAHQLLQLLRTADPEAGSPAASPAAAQAGEAAGSGPVDAGAALLWEFGDAVDWREVVRFLLLTGDLGAAHRRLVARAGPEGRAPQWSLGEWKRRIEERLRTLAARWGWTTGEEIRVTMGDLGIDPRGLERHLVKVLTEESEGTRALREGEDAALGALRIELALSGLDLKQALARYGSFRWLAARDRAAGNVDPAAREESQRKLCLAWGVGTWERYLQGVGRDLGTAEPAERLRDDLAVVRRAAARLRSGPEIADAVPPGSAEPPMASGPPSEEESAEARRIAQTIAVTRIALIGELTRLGARISQVSRPDGTWSSTYGSGKGESAEEAVLGGILEELEKWSQERFSERREPDLRSSYAALPAGRAVDPELLPLPYDSIYRPDLEIDWSLGRDEISGRERYLPSAVVHRRRFANDVMLSRRAGRRISDTNGLAAGFSREHAVLHGVCEVIERHATRLAELRLWNPGSKVPPAYRFVRPESARPDVRALLERVGAPLSLLDITSEVRVPTVMATLIAERAGAPYLCQGWGCHPDPHLAVRRAVLEACQTLAVSTAGGREDLTLRARSLGRHERPRPLRGNEAAWWRDPDRETIDVDEIAEMEGRSVGLSEGLALVLRRVRAAGLDSVITVDLSQPETRPAHAVRIVIPGLEAINPFHTGRRGRMALLEDLLPRLPHGTLSWKRWS
jgi:ribosomal protein S12 methylthiotransferase accessory factor